MWNRESKYLLMLTFISHGVTLRWFIIASVGREIGFTFCLWPKIFGIWLHTGAIDKRQRKLLNGWYEPLPGVSQLSAFPPQWPHYQQAWLLQPELMGPAQSEGHIVVHITEVLPQRDHCLVKDVAPLEGYVRITHLAYLKPLLLLATFRDWVGWGDTLDVGKKCQIWSPYKIR